MKDRTIHWPALVAMALMLTAGVVLLVLGKSPEAAVGLISGGVGILLPQAVRKVVVPLVLIGFLAGCGASNVAMVAPVFDATRVVCRVRQEAAFEEATSRDEATRRVAEVRQRCDVAYRGLEAAGLLLEQVHDQE